MTIAIIDDDVSKKITYWIILFIQIYWIIGEESRVNQSEESRQYM